MVARMRTVQECYEEIKTLDNGTAVTQWFIRNLCKHNKVKHFMTGKKILVNFDDLLSFLNFES